MSIMSTSNNACNNVQLVVLILCIFFTMVGELISLFVYTDLVVKSRSVHIIASITLFSLLIKAFAEETNISIALFYCSIGFCSYSITLTQYLNRVRDARTRKETICRLIHWYLYIVFMTINVFLCLYTLMGWSYIDKLLYARVNELLFCGWSVIALGYGIACIRMEVTRHSVPCRMVNYCGAISRPVARLTLFVTWCILQIMVFIMAVASIFSPLPDHIFMYMPDIVIAQWIIHYAHDRLDHRCETNGCHSSERLVENNALEIVWYAKAQY
jgi:hypothetical protein